MFQEKVRNQKAIPLSYAAPEILLGNAAQFSTDWTSVGLTLGSLVQNEKLFRQRQRLQL